MKIRLVAGHRETLTVQLEPSGMEYTVGLGGHFIYEWPDGGSGVESLPTLGVSDGMLVVEQMSDADRLWSSDGGYLPITG